MLAPSGSSWSSGTSALAHSTPAAVPPSAVPQAAQLSSGTEPGSGSAAGTAPATVVPAAETRAATATTTSDRRHLTTDPSLSEDAGAPWSRRPVNGGHGTPDASARATAAVPRRSGPRRVAGDAPGSGRQRGGRPDPAGQSARGVASCWVAVAAPTGTSLGAANGTSSWQTVPSAGTAPSMREASVARSSQAGSPSWVGWAPPPLARRRRLPRL